MLLHGTYLVNEKQTFPEDLFTFADFENHIDSYVISKLLKIVAEHPSKHIRFAVQGYPPLQSLTTSS